MLSPANRRSDGSGGARGAGGAGGEGLGVSWLAGDECRLHCVGLVGKTRWVMAVMYWPLCEFVPVSDVPA